MFTPKSLSPDSLDAALAKAERYRLLNEPTEAESISLDILEARPNHQLALTMLLLAITDQFTDELSGNVTRAQALVPRLDDEYGRAYYSGLIAERRAKAIMRRGTPNAGTIAYRGLRDAMEWYEKAEAIPQAANDDPILRWNACARLIDSKPQLKPPEPEPTTGEHFGE
ncbi:MAG: hypothetical protein V3R71_00275 [Gemmatimonadales bacterium]